MALTTLLFLVFVSGGILLCLVRHPVWGLYTYVLLFYLDAPTRWWASDLLKLRWSLIIVGVTLIGIVIYKFREVEITERKSFLSHAPHALFIVYVMWMYVQYPWVISPEHDAGVEIFTKYVVIMYLIYQLVDNRERVIGFLAAHIIGCFYLAILAFLTTTAGRLDGVGGAGIDDSNNLGMYMATAAIAAGGLFFAMAGWPKWLPILVMPFCLNALVQAGSRGAFLALLAGCAVVYFYRPPKITMTLWVYGAAGIVLFAFLAEDAFMDRMASIKDAAQQNEQADTSAISRIYIAKSQLRMAADYPFGLGHKGTEAMSRKYIAPEYWSSDGGRSSHNTFLSTLVDQGFIGFFLWCALNWKIFQKCRGVARWAKRENDDQLAWLVATALGILSVVWVGGIFAPFLKAEVFFWMIPLVCSLWANSAGAPAAAEQTKEIRATI